MGWNMPGKTGCNEKLGILEEIIISNDRIALAYSGGMDSAFLLWFLTRTCQRRNFWAVHFVADSAPKGSLESACHIAKQFRAPLLLIPAPEAGNNDYLKNDARRCYYCKKDRFTALKAHKLLHGFCIVDGTQYDDLGEHRPGMKAGRELGIMSPLLEARIGKEDIRMYARRFKLPLAEMMPESCLATRIASGETISLPHMEAIDKCEQMIKQLGFRLVRMRSSGERASLEFLPEEIGRARELIKPISEIIASYGWCHVDLNLRVYGG